MSGAVGELPATVRQMRRELRALQKAVSDLTGEVRTLVAARKEDMAVPPAPEEDLENVRFTARTAKALRQRFDLTQQELARLLEVSTMTITAWESGKSKPRRSNMAQIVTLREMSQEAVDGALGREPAPPAVKPDQIRALRERLDLTQADLGEMLGASTASVASWETAKTTPSRRSRAALAALRGTSATEVEQKLESTAAGRRRSARKSRDQISAAEIRALRTKAGMSQQAFARQLGVSVNTVSNWETSRTVPRGRSAEKLVAMRG
jgi:DNA-binding transcriptional regulator YiaG